MEHFAQKKVADENCYFLKFKTILSHFALERGPFLKTRDAKPFILQRPPWRNR